MAGGPHLRGRVHRRQYFSAFIDAARRADKAIINVVAKEWWMELQILVPNGRYRRPNALPDLREEIEAENEGVVIPPFSMR